MLLYFWDVKWVCTTLTLLNETLNFQLARWQQPAVVAYWVAPSSWRRDAVVALGCSQMITCAALRNWITTLLRKNELWINRGWIKTSSPTWEVEVCFWCIHLDGPPLHHPAMWLTEACWEIFPSAAILSKPAKIWWLIPSQHKTVWKMKPVFLVERWNWCVSWVQRTGWKHTEVQRSLQGTT